MLILWTGRLPEAQADVHSRRISSKLTWAGHEFLDAARSEPVWSKTKALAKEKGVSLSVGLLTGLLKHVASQALGL